jgi:phosphopantothenoylcysteine decarboxylase/phosphopantothenate--cysteine ligase
LSLRDKDLILGVTGSIAAFKAVYLLRELTRLGARVTVVTTAHAEKFIGPLTFRTLSGRPVLSDLFDPQSPDAVEHVALAERAHAVVVAPATANLLARAAHGIADDFLTTLLLAARGPVLMAPAMDGGMWDHAAVAANVRTLRERGVTVLEPDAGELASGLSGRGRLPEVDAIVEALERLLSPRRDLVGERVLVTSGPTREPIDPVRYISNRSSGKMGQAVATAALRRGAKVILISGPTALTPPGGAVYVPVQTAEDMREAALQLGYRHDHVLRYELIPPSDDVPGQGLAALPEPSPLDVFFVALGRPARMACLKSAQELRRAGVRVELEHRAASMKARYCGRIAATAGVG